LKNSAFRKKLTLTLVCLFVTASYLPIINGSETKYDSVTTSKNQYENQLTSSEWRQLIGEENAGFGKNTNIGLRGIEIFNDELYLGTQSFNKSKILDCPSIDAIINFNRFFDNDLSQSLTIITMKRNPFSFILSRNLKYFNYFIEPWLSSSLNLAMHMRAKMSDGCEIWRYNYSTDAWNQIIGDRSNADMSSGFGDNKNLAASVFKEFKGKLYVGTWTSPLNGCEIWRYDGIYWEQLIGKNAVIKGGFNDSNNIAAWCMEEFNGCLYVGTMNWDYTSIGGCQVWRTNNGNDWEKVVDRGFRDFLSDSEQNVHNTYAWSVCIYKDQLYIGTFNTNSVFSMDNSGCQLWRSSEGINWEKVSFPGGNGFGEPENYGVRSMAVYQDDLYIATATDAYQPNGLNVQGCEIWKFDGENWTEMIGEGKSDNFEKDGFGNKWNKYIWSIDVSSDDKLWAGTLNMQIRVIGENTEGCEVWCYDGESWKPIVKNEIGEIENGFGYLYNEGARVMKELPVGSGNIVIGTFKVVKPPKISEGCEVWIREIPTI